MLLITLVVVLLVSAVSVKSKELKVRDEALKAEQAELEARIQEEEARAESLNEYEKYTQTKKYIEDVAKEKLGMVHEGEIIFRNSDEEVPVG
ncbi:MAG: septum formation initiator family protein [Lachnospiraceae bacterium]|nr:septum formation initiator family protein [Lachnospiraceae bacterium]